MIGMKAICLTLTIVLTCVISQITKSNQNVNNNSFRDSNTKILNNNVFTGNKNNKYIDFHLQKNDDLVRINEFATPLFNGILITWTKFNSEMTDSDISGQIFSDTGAVFSEFKVNEYGLEIQEYSPSTAFQRGGFVVVFLSRTDGKKSDDKRTCNIMARTYYQNYSPVTTEFQIDDSVYNDYGEPVVASFADNSFIVVWHTINPYIINARIVVNANGRIKKNPIFQVNEKQNIQYPEAIISNLKVLTLENNNIVIIWCFEYDLEKRIYMKMYNNNGEELEPELKININNGDIPAASALPNSQFVIVWHSSEASNEVAIKARVFNDNGTPYAEEISIVKYFAHNLSLTPKITSTNDGFVVAWNHKSNIYAKKFDVKLSKLSKVTTMAELNGITNFVNLLYMQSGKLVTVWSNQSNKDLYSQNIQGRIYDSDYIQFLDIPECQNIDVTIDEADDTYAIDLHEINSLSDKDHKQLEITFVSLPFNGFLSKNGSFVYANQKYNLNGILYTNRGNIHKDTFKYYLSYFGETNSHECAIKITVTQSDSSLFLNEKTKDSSENAEIKVDTNETQNVKQNSTIINNVDNSTNLNITEDPNSEYTDEKLNQFENQDSVTTDDTYTAEKQDESKISENKEEINKSSNENIGNNIINLDNLNEEDRKKYELDILVKKQEKDYKFVSVFVTIFGGILIILLIVACVYYNKNMSIASFGMPIENKKIDDDKDFVKIEVDSALHYERNSSDMNNAQYNTQAITGINNIEPTNAIGGLGEQIGHRVRDALDNTPKDEINTSDNQVGVPQLEIDVNDPLS